MTFEPNALKAKAESSIAYCKRHPGVELFVEVDSNELLALFETIAQLHAEIANLKSIIAKELSENDEFGSEFVLVNILKSELETARRVREKLKDSLFWFEVNSYDKRDAEKAGQFWREIAAIEKDGTK